MQKTEIEEIVQARLKDAEVLLEASRFDGSVYLCGYAIELSLKARICRTLQWDEYPTSGKYSTFKTHDLDVLLHLTGLEDKMKLKYMTERSIVAQWNPEARYKPIGSANEADAKDMLDSSKELIKQYMREQVEKCLSETKGQFELFALFLREDSPDKWDLLISADWARVDKKASINIIIGEIRKELTDQELLLLSRIIILDKDDPALNAIHKAMKVEHGLIEISDNNFFGLAIKHAYLVTSQREVHNKTNSVDVKSSAVD